MAARRNSTRRKSSSRKYTKLFMARLGKRLCCCDLYLYFKTREEVFLPIDQALTRWASLAENLGTDSPEREQRIFEAATQEKFDPLNT